MRTALCSLLLLLCCHAAMAGWKEDDYYDRLAEQKIIRMATPASGNIRQFGHAVTARLIVSCLNPFEDKEKYKDEDYLSGFLVFSERVAVGDATARIRFDNGAVQTISAGASDRGEYFSLSGIKSSDIFTPQLRTSRKLRIEIALPWAGNVLLTMNTEGAEQALAKIPCGSTRQ